MPRTTRNRTKKIPSFATPDALANRASMSSRMPLITKKNGMKTPNATAVSLESNAGSSRSLRTCRVIMPAANPPRSRSSPRSAASHASRNTSTTIQRTPSCELASIVRSSIGIVRSAERTASTATSTATATNPIRSRALCSAPLGREEQRQQQDRPELADRAGREQVAAEVRLQLARVREDRDQRADRRRRQRRPDVEERDYDAERGQHAAERVGDRERQEPAQHREPQRLPLDAPDVDLVAGEEEQHAQPEVGEELRERVRRPRGRAPAGRSARRAASSTTTTGTNRPRAPTTAATVAAIAPVATIARNEATSTLTHRDRSGDRGERASPPGVNGRPAIAGAPALWLPASMRRRYRHSLIVVPVLYLVARDRARDAGAGDRPGARRRGRAGVGIDTARDILSATATGMIAFTGFVLASVLVVVQFAAGQYSPRLVLWFRRDVSDQARDRHLPRRVHLRARGAARDRRRAGRRSRPTSRWGSRSRCSSARACCTSRSCSE